MTDQRDTKLAKILTGYSIHAKRGDKVLIRTTSPAGLPLAREVYKQLVDLGAHPHMTMSDERAAKYFLSRAKTPQLTHPAEIDAFIANWCDKSVTIVADENTRELVGVPGSRMLAREKVTKPIRDTIIKKPWILTYYPTQASAQDANMSYEEFRDFYYRACLRDWATERKRQLKLAKLLTNAKLIEVKGERTNLRMSAVGRIFIPCAGEYNMPDGEVFTAPVDDSVEGEVYFNYPLLRRGRMIRDIFFRFERGRIVHATASENQKYLLEILDTDPGARRLGEFAIGLNPGIRTYMNNVLFDEKMRGTVHMAIGEAYEECNGTNKSTIHMDIVKDMTNKGSSVVADGKTILKDGKVVGA